ncbi:MAG: hypothetical protein M1127_03490 [Patescibacteria group bacterium]|nr:hypothetical protein [Patescibacteria group bacterium]
MTNLEKPGGNKETEFDLSGTFDRNVFDFLPKHIQNDLRFILERSLAVDKATIKERLIEFINGYEGFCDLQKSLSSPQNKIEANIILEPENPIVREHRLHVSAVLLKQVSGEAPQYAGYISLFFHCDGKKNEIYILSRELKEQGMGFGLDLECQIEDFCRRAGIWNIRNRPTTAPYGYVGGYVWAKYGYEFDDSSDVANVRDDIKRFAKEQNIIIKESDLNRCKRPIDFASLKGKNENGDELPAGKLSLLEHSQWHGRRDLQFDSQGTKDFVAYLKQRGRRDLIEKFYPMFLEKISKRA